MAIGILSRWWFCQWNGGFLCPVRSIAVRNSELSYYCWAPWEYVNSLWTLFIEVRLFFYLNSERMYDKSIDYMTHAQCANEYTVMDYEMNMWTINCNVITSVITFDQQSFQLLSIKCQRERMKSFWDQSKWFFVTQYCQLSTFWPIFICFLRFK